MYYVTGPPLLKYLTAMNNECSILSNWDPPYLLPGLTVSYKVYINGTLHSNVSTTNYTYYPNVNKTAVYNISVAAYNESVSDGQIVEAIVEFYISKI